MCGIVGFWSRTAESKRTNASIRAMCDAIAHRGPDDYGRSTPEQDAPVLGHRRLSILDLSPDGHQPMESGEGRFVLSFNGEIYNYRTLRAELALAGTTFRGRSDTEVMLAAFELWGLERTVRRLTGMFAFALWDRHARSLSLVRDRFGEKPLFFGEQRGTLLFGSELKALRQHPCWEGEIDRGALQMFLRYNYIVGPNSIYANISKVRPGTIVTFSEGVRDPVESVYWSTAQVAAQARAIRPIPSPEELLELTSRALQDAVVGQMVADVPVGAFLSGGIDSSLIVALMQCASRNPVSTFTIGFTDQRFDESPYARAIASHLGTNHTELLVTPAEALAVIPHLPAIYDEPFADSSQIPTYLVAQLARRHVTVSLSGDGGDEVFGGYPRYVNAEKLQRLIAKVPHPFRHGLGSALAQVAPETWDTALRSARRLGLPGLSSVSGDKIHKVGALLKSRSAIARAQIMLSQWLRPSQLVIGGAEPTISLDNLMAPMAGASEIEQLMILDTMSYLPDDILVKVDRATMSVGLESRAPFLDRGVFEMAWQLPLDMKIRDGRQKWVLRTLLERHVPSTLIDRPKMGFSIPVAAWLRGPLRDWSEDLLDARRLKQQGVLDASLVRSTVTEHMSGERDHSHRLWSLLMFQGWFDSTHA